MLKSEVLTFKSSYVIITIMLKIVKRVKQFRHDCNLAHYLKCNPEKAQGMTVKEVNDLLGSFSDDSVMDKSNYIGTKTGQYPKRTYETVLKSVKSENINGYEI